MDKKELLKTYWGFSAFRPLQEEIIDSVLAGKDTLAFLPTGGGKSLCFQLPALAMNGICLVVTPLIALMKDQVEQLKKKGVSAIALFSGMSKNENDIALDNCIYGEVKFLYISPERIASPLFQERFKKMNINLLVVDEAHCISQWGYDFRPAYLQIASLREEFPKVPVIALTATATDKVKKDIAEKLLLKDANTFNGSFRRVNLSYSCFKEEDKNKKLLEVLANVKGSATVYVKSRNRTKQVADLLTSNKINADYYHAGLTTKERSQKQDNWITNRTRVIVATNAFGMGIDKPDVRIVVHFDAPSSLEAYYQEAGRGGRDEKKAYAVFLYHQHDLPALQEKIEESYPPISFIRKVYQSLANYFRIAAGAGNMENYNLEMEEFTRIYNLAKTETFYALKRLELEGFILLTDAFYQPSKIFFPVDHLALYQFQVANPMFDGFIKALLRMYGGEAFTNFVPISEGDVARHLNMQRGEVVTKLNYLNQVTIINYQQQNDKPQVTFTTPRFDAAKLPLNEARIEARKKTEEEKAEAVVNYLTQTGRCRQIVLMDYFGEVTDETCGICDICLKKKKESHAAETEQELRKKIVTLLTGQELTVWELVQQTGEKELILTILRQLLDEGVLVVTASGKYTSF